MKASRTGLVLLSIAIGLVIGSSRKNASFLPDKPPAEKNAALAYYAMKQIGVTNRYVADYRSMGYPGGDVPIGQGVCTDVVIRAMRGVKVDLQVLVHEDMKQAFSKYPRKWSLTRPDPNIDHRRVDNVACFFLRHKKALSVTDRAEDYKPGDIVTWSPLGRRPHIGIVSLQPASGDRYAMVHNFGQGAKLEDCLFAFRITGHYRYFRSGAR